MNAIIFDFDGTIGDSFEYVLQFLAKKAGHQLIFSDSEKLELQSLSMKDLALRLGLPKWRLPLIYFQGRSSMSRVMLQEHPFEGVPEALAALHQDGYQLFILSSNSQANIEKFLTSHGLSSYFEQVYGSVAIIGKARALHRVLKQHDLKPESTVYVGDETRDVVAAKKLDMPCVAVTWGFSSSAALSALAPMVVVHKPLELERVLQEWGRTI